MSSPKVVIQTEAMVSSVSTAVYYVQSRWLLTIGVFV